MNSEALAEQQKKIEQEYQHCIAEFKQKVRKLIVLLKEQMPYFSKSIEVIGTVRNFDDINISRSSILEFSSVFSKLNSLIENIDFLNKEQIEELIASPFFLDMQTSEKGRLESMLSTAQIKLEQQEKFNQRLSSVLEEKDREYSSLELEYLQLQQKYKELKSVKTSKIKEQSPAKNPPRIAPKLFNRINDIIQSKIEKKEEITAKEIVEELKKELPTHSETYLSVRARTALKLLAEKNIIIGQTHSSAEILYVPNPAEPKPSENIIQIASSPEPEKEQQKSAETKPSEIMPEKAVKPKVSEKLQDLLQQTTAPLIESKQEITAKEIASAVNKKSTEKYNDNYLLEKSGTYLKQLVEQGTLVSRKEGKSRVYYPTGVEISEKPEKKQITLKDKILEILKEQPKTAKELSKETGSPESYVRMMLLSMLDSGNVKKDGKIKISSNCRPSDLYSLPGAETVQREESLEPRQPDSSYIESIKSFLEKEPMTRRQISKAMGLSLTSTSRLIENLVESGDIKVCGTKRISARGHPPDLYSLPDYEMPDTEKQSSYSERQQKLLEILKQEPKTARELSDILGFSEAGVHTMLKPLLKSQEIKACGKIKTADAARASVLYSLPDSENTRRIKENELTNKERVLKILVEEPKTVNEISKQLKIQSSNLYPLLKELAESQKIKKCGTIKVSFAKQQVDLYSLFEVENLQRITEVNPVKIKTQAKKIHKKVRHLEKLKESDIYKKARDIIIDCLEKGTTMNQATNAVDSAVNIGKSMGTIYHFCGEFFEALSVKNLVSKTTEYGEYQFVLKVPREQLELMLEPEQKPKLSAPFKNESQQSRLMCSYNEIAEIVAPLLEKQELTMDEIYDRLSQAKAYEHLHLTPDALRSLLFIALDFMVSTNKLDKKQGQWVDGVKPTVLYSKRQKNEQS